MLQPLINKMAIRTHTITFCFFITVISLNFLFIASWPFHPNACPNLCVVVFLYSSKRWFLSSIQIYSKQQNQKMYQVGVQRPAKNPREVMNHDFPLPELGKVSPYGVYVRNDNTGFVNLGTSHDTPEFAEESVAAWWQKHRWKSMYSIFQQGLQSGIKSQKNKRQIWILNL